MILIQEIRSAWTKVSRGGDAAVRRNSVPEAAPFPAAGSAANKILHQRLTYAEENEFDAPIKSEIVEHSSDPITVGCVKIDVSNEKLIVAYEYDHKCGGAPARHGRPGENLREEVTVERGSWARVKCNGRFVGDEWWYEKLVVNVGLFERHEAAAFYSTRPAREIIQLADLR